LINTHLFLFCAPFSSLFTPSGATHPMPPPPPHAHQNVLPKSFRAVGIYCTAAIYRTAIFQRATPSASKPVEIVFLPWHGEAICDLFFWS
jgi:hypothetical protein